MPYMTLVLLFESEARSRSYGRFTKSGGPGVTPKVVSNFINAQKRCTSAPRAPFDSISRLLWLSMVPGQYRDTSYLPRTHLII
jgi:hypothetical protein